MFFDDLDLGLTDGTQPFSQQAEPRLTPSSTISSSDPRGSGGLITQLIYAMENERYAPSLLPYPNTLLFTVFRELASAIQHADQLEEAEKTASLNPEYLPSLLPFRPSDILRVEQQRLRFFVSELIRTRVRKIESLAMAIADEARVAAEDGQSTPVSDDATSSLLGNHNHTASLSSVKTPLFPPTPLGSARSAGGLDPLLSLRGAGAGGVGESGLSSLRSLLSANELALADHFARLQHACCLQNGLQLAPEPLRYLVPNPPRAEGAEILPALREADHVLVLALEDLGSVALEENLLQPIQAGEVYLMRYEVVKPYVLSGRARLV